MHEGKDRPDKTGSGERRSTMELTRTLLPAPRCSLNAIRFTASGPFVVIHGKGKTESCFAYASEVGPVVVSEQRPARSGQRAAASFMMYSLC
jgi:hypothetical protein